MHLLFTAVSGIDTRLHLGNATGTVDNVERFFESFGWSSFEFNGGEIYHSAWIAGLFLVIGLTGMPVGLLNARR